MLDRNLRCAYSLAQETIIGGTTMQRGSRIEITLRNEDELVHVLYTVISNAPAYALEVRFDGMRDGTFTHGDKNYTVLVRAIQAAIDRELLLKREGAELYYQLNWDAMESWDEEETQRKNDARTILSNYFPKLRDGLTLKGYGIGNESPEHRGFAFCDSSGQWHVVTENGTIISRPRFEILP